MLSGSVPLAVSQLNLRLLYQISCFHYYIFLVPGTNLYFLKWPVTYQSQVELFLPLTSFFGLEIETRHLPPLSYVPSPYFLRQGFKLPRLCLNSEILLSQHPKLLGYRHVPATPGLPLTPHLHLFVHNSFTPIDFFFLSCWTFIYLFYMWYCE